MDKCIQQASNVQLTPENCFHWLLARKRFDLPPVVKDKIVTYISQNFEKVCSMQEILDVDHSDMLNVLNHKCFGEVSEKTLYDTLVSWMCFDKAGRRKVHLPQLLESRAMKQCKMRGDLDMCALLNAASFNIGERDLVWNARFQRLNTVSTRPGCRFTKVEVAPF